MIEHPSEDVKAALIRLADALCTYERATGVANLLILRDANGYCFRAMDGKPAPSPYQVSDLQLLGLLNNVQGNF